VGDVQNCWQPENEEDMWLNLELKEEASISAVQCIFDSNLSKQITISISDTQLNSMEKTTPSSLVSDFKLEFIRNGETVHSQVINNNYQRRCRIELPEDILCDNIKMSIISTHGVKLPKVFGISAYVK